MRTVEQGSSVVRALARFCFSHRRLVLLGWVAALAGLSLISQSVGSAYKDTFSLNGTQSFQAQALLEKAAPRASGDREQVVIAARAGRVTDPANRRHVEAMLAKLSALGAVASVSSPYRGAGAASQVSPSGQVAFAEVTLRQQAVHITPAEAKEFVATAKSAQAGGRVEVEVGGEVGKLAEATNVSSVGFGAAAALVVLLIVFGSPLAAALPLVTAGFALGAATAATGLLSHVIDMASFSSQLSLLIGLGVGVDYALFLVTRYRQGLLRGHDPQRAVLDALDTSGRAVMFAGVTVCIALLGMFALGVSFLYGVAIAASVTVLLTVVAALTLLPALLGFFGTRTLGRRQRRALAAGRLSTADEPSVWSRWAASLQARPALFALLATALTMTIAIPFLSMRLGSADSGSDPAGSTTRQAYDLLARGFGPGYNGPLQLVASVAGPGQQAAFARALSAVASTPGVVRTTPPVLLPGPGGGPGVVLAQAYPAGSPQDASTTSLLHHLRDTVVPGAAASGSGAAGTGVHVLIGGQTAIFDDFAGVLSSKLPLFIGVVVLLSFLLLTAVFRSLVIPAMAAVMNLLSAGAAFGIITAVFQWGWGSGLLGIDKNGPIEAFVPVMMFAILFGLSMDYQVFLVSRIYEEWHRTGENRLAVTRGLAATGRTITAAAAIMVLVFAAFILGGQRIIELFGLGLAAGVLIDALVIRSVLVPSLMLMLGKANWALPRTLDRLLPRLNVEGTADDDDPPPPHSDPGPIGAPVPASAG
jgi:RND superfamily putative drug exporter